MTDETRRSPRVSVAPLPLDPLRFLSGAVGSAAGQEHFTIELVGR